MSARCVMGTSLWPAGQRCSLIRHRLIDNSSTGCSDNSKLTVEKREEVKASDREGLDGVVRSGCGHALPPSTVSVALSLSWCFPVAKMTDFAHRTRFQQDAVSKVHGSASVLTGEVGIFAVKVQNETQTPVRVHFGSSVPAALVPDRYALLFVLN